ncbi:MAG: type II secretion system GspH family protein [Dysosmobacter sp.]|nr:type II secretion system GspH family protein [Dysosmobacter sp.]
MEKLKAKLRKQGGFTMVELLIVVAIIAVLVAISIPMMNTALERSRHAVDQANVRDAIGLALTEYVSEGDDALDTYVYIVDDDTHQGHIEKVTTAVTAADGVTPKCQCGSVTGGLTVTIEAPGPGEKVPKVTTSWKNDGKGGPTIATP